MRVFSFAAKLAILATVSAVSIAKPGTTSQKQSNLPLELGTKNVHDSELPDGWKERVQVGERLDDELFERATIISPDANEEITLRLAGKVMHVHESTRKVLEVLH